MKQEEKLFNPDFSKKLFRIIIDVYDNGNTFGLEKSDEKHNATYQEIIGALEIVKFGFINKQSSYNVKVGKKIKPK
jgi:hypothetical protein